MRNAMQRMMRHYCIRQWFRILSDFLHQTDVQSLEPLLLLSPDWAPHVLQDEAVFELISRITFPWHFDYPQSLFQTMQAAQYEISSPSFWSPRAHQAGRWSLSIKLQVTQ